jgi:hypothetical protein
MLITTDELLAIADKPGLWTSMDGLSNSLRSALLGTAKISAQGRTPHKLQGPADVEVGHSQMLELWKRLNIVPPGASTQASTAHDTQ